ncbi:caspase family protein [bacterium]|nr:caspase family protein [bacterium]
MRSIINRFIVIAGILVFLVPNISLSMQEKRIALVIGNGSYKSSPLANPVNDAHDMAAALKRSDFKVMKAINANRREMRRAIRRFGDEINKGAVGLFYYAGHGIQVNGENYLVPIGAGVYGEDEVEDECLNVSSVLRKMESAGNRLNIIILDACRNNPFGRSFRSSTLGLAKMDAPTGSILAYATAPGSVAADGTGRNGLYTSKLLKHMMKPGLKIEEFFKQVRIDVRNDTGKRQVPWESSSLTGDFYFISERGISVVKRPTVEPERPKIDEGLEAERERLERERQELERMKVEIERKKLEGERKSLELGKKKSEIIVDGEWTETDGVCAGDSFIIKQRSGDVILIVVSGRSFKWIGYNIKWESPRVLVFSRKFTKKPWGWENGDGKVTFISEKKAIYEWTDIRGYSGIQHLERIK